MSVVKTETSQVDFGPEKRRGKRKKRGNKDVFELDWADIERPEGRREGKQIKQMGKYKRTRWTTITA